MAMADVTVLGAGIFGLCCAWSCAARGARVQVIDPGGVASGASGGVVGALAPHVPENWNEKKAFQLDSLLMARTFWPEIEALSGLPSGYSRAGRVQPVADEAALALARARSDTAQELWQGQATWEVVEAQPGDWLPGSPSGWVIRDTLSAHIHPRQACLALAAACAKQGVTFNAKAEASGAVIHATGASGLAELSTALNRPIGAAIKGQAAILRCDQAGQPQLFLNGLHVIPHGDGTVAIGSTTERDAPDLTTDAQLETLIETARTQVPALRDAPVAARWAGWRPRGRSRAPLLGAWPDRSGHFIANGGFKIGFGMAPKVGDAMADLVLDQRTTYPEGFDISAVL